MHVESSGKIRLLFSTTEEIKGNQQNCFNHFWGFEIFAHGHEAVTFCLHRNSNQSSFVNKNT